MTNHNEIGTTVNKKIFLIMYLTFLNKSPIIVLYPYIGNNINNGGLSYEVYAPWIIK